MKCPLIFGGKLNKCVICLYVGCIDVDFRRMFVMMLHDGTDWDVVYCSNPISPWRRIQECKSLAVFQG